MVTHVSARPSGVRSTKWLRLKDRHRERGVQMKTIVYFEKMHLHGCELIAKARSFKNNHALCENETCCPAAFSAGADEAVVIDFIYDDCAGYGCRSNQCACCG